MTPNELIDVAYKRLKTVPYAHARKLPFTAQEISDWLATLSDEDFTKVVVFSAYKQLQEGQQRYAEEEV